MMHQVDIAIIGGGMVGLSLAAALKETDLRIAVIEGTPPCNDLAPLPDVRVSALSRASQRYLSRLDVWGGITARRLTPYHKMEVKERDGFGHIAFDAADLAEPDLGHIVENRVIQLALWEAVSQQANVTLLSPARCLQLSAGEHERFISLDDGSHLCAKMVVGADGANSWVRQQLDIPLTSWDYEHTALVANVRSTEPHQSTARQVFNPEGPLAFLPMFEDDLCSVVWSLPPDQAQAMLHASPDEFNRRINVAFDNQLGLCQVEGERHIVPLRMRYARDFVKSGCVLIGDAAHTIHPLAGQGVNLGLMDSAALAERLISTAAAGGDITDFAALRAFERERKTEAAQMIAAMEAFKRLFEGQHPLKKFIRNTGLALASNTPGVKRQVMQRALGLHAQIPMLAQ